MWVSWAFGNALSTKTGVSFGPLLRETLLWLAKDDWTHFRVNFETHPARSSTVQLSSIGGFLRSSAIFQPNGFEARVRKRMSGFDASLPGISCSHAGERTVPQGRIHLPNAFRAERLRVGDQRTPVAHGTPLFGQVVFFQLS